jgi:hypothetical protein
MWFVLINVLDVRNHSRSTQENGNDRWSVFVPSNQGFLRTTVTEGAYKELEMKLKKNGF